ncbi:MAG: acetylornithine deacetylase [Cyclobacteriaceae bacterium]|jgi:acetylornithine deacetylase
MDVKELLKDLMAFPVLGGESNLTILSYIEQYLQQFDIQVHRVYNEDGTKASMHCRIGPPVSGGYILSGHMDVVPVAGQQWNTDPFVLTEKGDKLYGRGSCDMKGFDASCLAAIPYLVKLDLKKPIYLAFSYDEEIGCLGAPDLVAAINSHYEEKPQYAIIGEPSMMIPTIGQKGICIFETTVNGSAGHSSRIMQEVSAIHEASRLVIWLEGLMKSLVSKGNVDPRFDPPHTSIHCGVFKGGIAPNVISDQCTFTWDVRNIPMDRIDDIKQQFDDHCAIRTAELKSVFPDFEIKTVEHHLAVPALDTDASDALVGLLQKLSENNRTDAVSYAAEAGQFAEGGFTSIICGPGDIAQAHRADEFISIDQLNQGEAMIRKLGDYLSRDK